ncbi:Troponin I, slow skeletal muscle [Branchiostoma belcheri]|nr:Troponin I, slow skeletal muscle [Branchiostoma belcheri]
MCPGSGGSDFSGAGQRSPGSRKGGPRSGCSGVPRTGTAGPREWEQRVPGTGATGPESGAATHGAVHGHFLPCTGMYRDRVRAYNVQYTTCTQKVVHFRECTGHVRDWTRFVCRTETPGFYRKPKISGKVVTVLGIHASTTISMDSSGTYFAIEGKFLNKFQASLEIEASYGSPKEAEFRATGTFKNDLFRTLRDKVEGFMDNLVKEANKAIDSATNVLNKVEKACDAARKPFNKAKAKVARAQRGFDKAVAALRKARRGVEKGKKKFADAGSRPHLKHVQDATTHDVKCHAKNALRAACKVALKIAEVAVKKTRYTLYVAKLAVKAAQKIVDRSRWTLDAAKGVLEGTKVAVHETCDIGVTAAKGALTAVKETHKFGIKVAEKVTTGVLGGVLDIREISFSATVAVAKTGSFKGRMKASFFGDNPVTINFSIKIYSIEDMVTAICDVIKDILDV